MGVTLGHNQYGKAETRVVRVYRDADPHEIVDYNVSVALSGDFEDIHLTGDNANCLTTDATKNTVNAFAKEHGEAARQPESFGVALAKHFVDDSRRCTGSGSSSRCTRGTGCPTTGRRTRMRSPGTAGTSAPPPSPTTAANLWVVSGVTRLRGAQDHRLGVLGLPAGPVHHPAADPRPGDGHLGDRAVVAHRPRRGLGQVLRPARWPP